MNEPRSDTSQGWQRPWAPGSATGIGSLPGTDIREAMRLVLGELPDLPHVPELPARGPGADLIGRAAGLLVDMPVDLQPAGWRLVDRPSADERRARSLLGEDLDAAEEFAGQQDGPFKVQVAGPWTLSASLELSRGERALHDPGAVRDIVASLAEGVATLLMDVRKRLPHADVLLQIDEPSLPAVLRGRVPTQSGYGTLRSVEPNVVRDGLRSVLDAAGPEVTALVHCCAPDIPIPLLRAAGAAVISLDLTAVGERGGRGARRDRRGRRWLATRRGARDRRKAVGPRDYRRSRTTAVAAPWASGRDPPSGGRGDADLRYGRRIAWSCASSDGPVPRGCAHAGRRSGGEQ